MGTSCSTSVKLPTTINMKTLVVLTAIVASSVIALPAVPHPAAYHESPKPYAYEYGVHDQYTGANFAQSEKSDTKAVTGSYTVALPDGRTQIVNYHADPYGYGGYVADVQYKGQATYPVYKPRPAYHPHA